MLIRKAVIEDADRLAWVHMRCWQQAYSGLMPDAFLERRTDDLAERAVRWREWIAGGDAPWVAVGEDGEINGFASGGAARDEDVKGVGELFAIYLLAEHWGTGVGHRLMEAATESLVEAGFKGAVLWVLDGNVRARRFYEAAGWLPDGTAKNEQRDGFNLSEVRYRRHFLGPG